MRATDVPFRDIFESFERYHSKKSLSIEKHNSIIQNVSLSHYFFTKEIIKAPIVEQLAT